MSSAIRIAITGGGLAGASLLHALLQYDHLDVHIFESAPAFKEAGIAVGITRNALAALDLIGPSAAQALERAGAVPQKGFRIALAQGPSQGKLIGEMDINDPGSKRITSIVHRADFLRELLASVPKDRMHASKKLASIDKHSSSGPVTLHFTDGTTHECDILVGADGIHSTVRKLILGPNDPAVSARNSGWWGIMVLKPYEEAKPCIESLDIENAREHGFIGDGTYLMWNLLSHGQLLQLVATGYDEHVENDWTRMVTADEIRKLYQHWPEDLRNAVFELLCNQDKQPAIYFWEHPDARTYEDGPVCIMGDAAHATTPWQASGGGMSIEDSLILSTLLGRARISSEAVTALKVYNAIRRPRTQRIVESCRKTGLMMNGVCEDTKLEFGEIKPKVTAEMGFHHESRYEEASRRSREDDGRETAK